jgi:hypothetical protein
MQKARAATAGDVGGGGQLGETSGPAEWLQTPPLISIGERNWALVVSASWPCETAKTVLPRMFFPHGLRVT